MARYLIATAISAGVTLGVPLLLHEELGVEPRIAVAVAFICALVVNFLTTRRFVFRSDGAARLELTRFVALSVSFRIAEYIVFLVLFASGLVYYSAQLIVVGLAFVLKYVAYKRLVFAPAATDALIGSKNKVLRER